MVVGGFGFDKDTHARMKTLIGFRSFAKWKLRTAYHNTASFNFLLSVVI